MPVFIQMNWFRTVSYLFFEKLSTRIWRLPFTVNEISNLFVNSKEGLPCDKMLCLDTFIPSGALSNILHTINKTMDTPVTFLRRFTRNDSEVTQHDGRKKRTAKTLVCDKRDKAITCVVMSWSCFLAFTKTSVSNIILLHEKFLQFDCLRTVGISA